MTVERSTVTLPPWRSAVARTIASPSPEPGRAGARPARARSARRRLLVARLEAGPLVADRQRGDAVLDAAARRSTSPPARTVDARRCRAGCRGCGASASGSPRTVTGPSTLGDARAAAAAPPRGHDRVQADRPLGRRARALALQRQQVADQPLQPRRVALRGRPATSGSTPWRARNSTLPASEVSGVRSSWLASARKRRSRSRAASSAASIPFSARGQLADLVVGLRGIGQPPRGVAGALDLAAAEDTRAQRAAARDGSSSAAAAAAHRGGEQAREQQQQAEPVQRLLDVGGAGGDEHDAARRRAAGVGDRRGVEADRFAARARRRRSRRGRGAARPHHAAVAAAAWRPSASERARIAPVAVEHLDARAGARRPAIPARPARVSTRGRRDAEPGDVDGARRRLLVERGVQLVGDDACRAPTPRTSDREQRRRASAADGQPASSGVRRLTAAA